MRNAILLVALVFAVSLALVIGNRLSSEATAVLVGALCGISATMPISLALLIATSRNWGRGESGEASARYAARDTPRAYAPQPPLQGFQPVIVVSPPQTQSPYGYSGSPYFLPAASSGAPTRPREFKIIGEE